MRLPLTRVLVTTLIAICCGGSQCLKDIGSTIAHNATLDLERTLQNIATQPTVWLAELRQLEDKLRADASNLVDDVGQIMQRAIGAAGATVRCTVDFTGRRVARELQALIARIKGNTIPPAPPTVCSVTPEQISLGRIPTTLTFYGYDLRIGSVDAVVVNAGGPARSLNHLLTAASEYAVTLNLSGNRANLTCEDQQIVLRFDGSDVLTQTNSASAVPVVWPICSPPPPPPPRQPPRILFSRTADCAGGLFGCREDRTYGGPCSSAFERQECQVIKLEGGGHCEQLRWTSDDPHNCGCIVHFGANALDGIKCDIKIVEVGVQPPPPPAPPCSCRNGVPPQG